MKELTLLLAGCALVGCGVQSAPVIDRRLAQAESLIDAFYSFDQARLRTAMTSAEESMPDTLYYQQWAEAGHYVVLKRQPCRLDKSDEVRCEITVKDDLVPALGSSFRVTDVFHLAYRDGRIVKVWNSSDDPPEFDDAMQWLRRERPEIFAGPCRDMFNGGPTPKDCVRAIVKGFANFSARRQAGSNPTP